MDTPTTIDTSKVMWNPLQGWLADFECQDFDFMSSFSLAPLVHGSSILK